MKKKPRVKKNTFEYADSRNQRERLDIMGILLNLTSPETINDIYKKYFRMPDKWWKEFFKAARSMNRRPSRYGFSMNMSNTAFRLAINERIMHSCYIMSTRHSVQEQYMAAGEINVLTEISDSIGYPVRRNLSIDPVFRKVFDRVTEMRHYDYDLMMEMNKKLPKGKGVDKFMKQFDNKLKVSKRLSN